MLIKNKIAIATLVLIATFAAGRYSTPIKIVTKTVTVEVEKKQENVDAKKNEVTVIVKKPDGTETTTITDNEDTKTKQTDQVSVQTDVEKTSIRDGSKVSISALAGATINNLQPTYGLSVSKALIGPIRVGAFGFNNGLVGVSLGLDL